MQFQLCVSLRGVLLRTIQQIREKGNGWFFKVLALSGLKLYEVDELFFGPYPSYDMGFWGTRKTSFTSPIIELTGNQ
jgi:hypothetical protein